MKKLDKYVYVTVAFVALLQTGVLAYSVWQRATILKHGKEIVLPVKPVDPRDLLRGEYVTLTYDISELPFNKAEISFAQKKTKLYITLKQGENQSWRLVHSSLGAFADIKSDEVMMVGTINNWSERLDNITKANVSYGIERFYVPEGEGYRIENLMRNISQDGQTNINNTVPLLAVIAVDSKGTAVLKELRERSKDNNGNLVYKAITY